MTGRPRRTQAGDQAGSVAIPPSPHGVQADGDEALWEEITNRLEEFCREHNLKLSPSRRELVRDLVQMKKLWGEYYCPCQTERVPETVCVCTAVKDGLVEVMGACFCGLIVSA